MGMFLQILLAVAIVIAVLIALGFFWVKNRIKRAVGDFTAASEIFGEDELKPARIQLSRIDNFEYSVPFEALFGELKSLGFQRIADCAELRGAYQSTLATRHRDLPIAAAITEDYADSVHFHVFSMNQQRNVFGMGNDPVTTIVAGKVDWQSGTEITAESAFKSVRDQLTDTHLHFDLKLFRAVFEQVYALRADQKIVHMPTIETIENRAAENGKTVSPDQIQTAYDIALDHWKSQIDEVVLDKYRRTSKIDAVAWEEFGHDIQVVHNRLDNEEISDLIIQDEISEKIVQQCVAQGLDGIDLYIAVNDLLPPNQQLKKIGAIDRPLKAELYIPNNDFDSDTRTAQKYVYEAEDMDGGLVQGSIVATGSGDAKKQIAGLGLMKAKLLIEPTSNVDSGNFDDILLDDEAATIAAKATREGVFSSVMRALVANWWIWAPPIGFVAKTNIDGTPYTWGDYAVFGWAIVAALAMIFLIAPMIFYNQLLLAELRGNSKLARVWIAALKITGRFSGITSNQLTIERCKALAAEDRLEDALALVSSIRNDATDEEYQAGLVAIYGAGGAWQPMMDAQRAYLEATPSKETATVDLAMSVARYCDDVDSAEPLIRSVKPTDLPEIALIGYQYVRGLIAAHRSQQSQALRHFAQAVETARQFETLPIMIGLIAEINGHVALTYKKSGKTDRAEQLWQQVFPILEPHHSSERLIKAYHDA